MAVKPARPGTAGVSRRKLPWYTKLAYGFGDSGMSASSTIIGLFLLIR